MVDNNKSVIIQAEQMTQFNNWKKYYILYLKHNEKKLSNKTKQNSWNARTMAFLGTAVRHMRTISTSYSKQMSETTLRNSMNTYVHFATPMTRKPTYWNTTFQ